MTFTKPEKSLVYSLIAVVVWLLAMVIVPAVPKFPNPRAALVLLSLLAGVNLLIWIPFPGRDWKGRFTSGR